MSTTVCHSSLLLHGQTLRGDIVSVEWPTYSYSMCVSSIQPHNDHQPTSLDYLLYLPDACERIASERDEYVELLLQKFAPGSRVGFVVVGDCWPFDLLSLATDATATALVILPTSAFEEFGFAFRYRSIGSSHEITLRSNPTRPFIAENCLPTYGISYSHSFHFKNIVDYQLPLDQYVYSLDDDLPLWNTLPANHTTNNVLIGPSPSPLQFTSWLACCIVLQIANLGLLLTIVRFLFLPVSLVTPTTTVVASIASTDSSSDVHPGSLREQFSASSDHLPGVEILQQQPSSPGTTPTVSFNTLPNLREQTVNGGMLFIHHDSPARQLAHLASDLFKCNAWALPRLGPSDAAKKKRWMIGEALLCVLRIFVLVEPLPFGISFHSHYTLIILQTLVFLSNFMLSTLVCGYVFLVLRKRSPLLTLAPPVIFRRISLAALPLALFYLTEATLRGIYYRVSVFEIVDASLVSAFLIWLFVLYGATALEFRRQDTDKRRRGDSTSARFPLRFWSLLASAAGVCLIIFGFLMMTTISVDQDPRVLPLKCFFVWFGSITTGYANFIFFASPSVTRSVRTTKPSKGSEGINV